MITNSEKLRRRTTRKAKRNRGKGFVKGLHGITDHPDYISMRKQTRAFLWDMARQYNGFNNGNLSASPGVMGKLGWSKWELLAARSEAEDAGWIQVTRLPKAKKQPFLYRLTWLATDKWDGKPLLDPGAHSQPVKKI